MLRASRLEVPAGITPNGMPVPARPEQMTRIGAVTAGAEHQVHPLGHRLGGHRPAGVVDRGLQPERPGPSAGLQLVLDVPAEHRPVGDLDRVVDDRAALLAGGRGRVRGLAPLPDDLDDRGVRDRDGHPADDQREGGDERAEQGTADDVRRCGEHRGTSGRRRPRGSARSQPTVHTSRARGAAPGDPEHRTDRDAGRHDADHVAGWVGVAPGRHHVQVVRRPPAGDGHLDQVGGGPTQRDGQQQREGRVPGAAVGTPRWRCRPGPRTPVRARSAARTRPRSAPGSTSGPAAAPPAARRGPAVAGQENSSSDQATNATSREATMMIEVILRRRDHGVILPPVPAVTTSRVIAMLVTQLRAPR